MKNVLFIGLICGFLCGSVHALTPDQVVVVVNRNSADSIAVAEHYLHARQIPADHRIDLDIEAKELISRADYEAKIADPIRAAMKSNGWDQSVTCLVTTFDVPLTVQSQQPSIARQRQIDALLVDMNDAKEQLARLADDMDKLAKDTRRPAEATTGPTTRSVTSHTDAVKSSAARAIERLSRLEGDDRLAGETALLELYRRGFGAEGLAKLQHDWPANLQSAVTAATRPTTKPSFVGDQAQQLAARRANVGLVGQAGEMNKTIGRLRNDETHAAVDSELMALWIVNYPLERWQNNPMALTAGRPTAKPSATVLMVARLDGPNRQTVIDLIDTSIRVEQTGLEGVLYLDARGLTKTDGYMPFDDDLRATARWIKDHSDFPVVLNDKPELFKAADAPNAALYCGWYALRKYQDTCQWVAGGVGYHVASLEMVSLHNPGETGWVVGLLKHGFVGTLGAVAEPYLETFPLPSLFFPMLLSGKYTAGEVYFRTTPTVSWAVGYVGDPLYNPFKVKPRVSEEALRSHPVLKNLFPEQ